MDLKDSEFRQIRDYLKENFGISMADEKRTLVYSRLRPLLRERGFESFQDFIDYVKTDKTGEASIIMANRLTTNHTFFMRESEHFDLLKKEALPWVVENFGAEKDLRMWCCASSSGEEPYTLQMVVQDFFANTTGWNTEILATDISEKVLLQASYGIYSNESLGVMPEEWLKKYFSKYDNDNMVVKDDIKRLMTFRKYNLMEEKMPFKRKFHIIFCRNVMIYFDNNTREQMAKRFYNVLEPGGWLFIGHSESLSNSDVGLKYIQPAVYRK
ncbi:MAG: protein-glutamate O-methyltransferase CheR [Defluviitaleaceae bacterium]|nr:protein-glutamate O-methyltransferase CheR [Defluviitaleaceae bacterium]